MDLLKQGPMKRSRGLEYLSYEEIFYNEGGKTLQQVAQGSCGCLIIGNVQGQVGQGFEKAIWASERCPCLWQGGWIR